MRPRGARTALSARTTGDYLYARAFSELSATGDAEGVQLLAAAALRSRAGRGDPARAGTQAGDNEEEYLRRCTLKTAELFRAACLLGSRDEAIGRFGLALGIAFQIADDILDCTGTTIRNREARQERPREEHADPAADRPPEDTVVREALAGGPLEGALIRVAQTGALERAREIALRYAAEARSHLGRTVTARSSRR